MKILNILQEILLLSSLVSSENVASVYLLHYVIQASIISVSNDSMALRFELLQVINNFAAEECCAVFQCWFVDNNFCTLCLYALHDALNGRLPEIVAI